MPSARGAKPLREVVITELSEAGTILVMGGRMAEDRGWVPERRDLQWVGGWAYLRLNKSSASLKALVGKPLTSNRWFDQLSDERDAACNETLQSLVAASEPVPAAGPKHQDDASTPLKNKRQLISRVTCPEVVSFPMEGPDGFTVLMEAIFTADFKTAPMLKATSEILTFVCKSLYDSTNEGRGVKRPRESRISFPYKEVRFNYARRCPYIAYRDAEGTWHTMHHKGTATEEDLEEKARWLHEQYQKLHHPSSPAKEADEAGDLPDSMEAAAEPPAGEPPAPAAEPAAPAEGVPAAAAPEEASS